MQQGRRQLEVGDDSAAHIAPQARSTLTNHERLVSLLYRWRYQWFLLPAALIGVALIAVPLCYTAYLSLRNYDLIRGIDAFIGLQNYVSIFTGDEPGFWKSIRTTLIYVVVVIAFDFILGMTQALLLFSMRPRWAKLWRAIFVLPILIIPSASAVFWRSVMYGPPNMELLRVLHLENVIPAPLGDQSLAFWAIVVTVIWAWSPWVFVLLSGGLDSIDYDVIEAAALDGASYIRTVFQVILPMMRPIIFIALSFKAVDSFLSFPFVWLMTQGGPGNSTHLASTYIYQQAFVNLQYGSGSAMAVVMLLMSTVLSIGAVMYWQRTQRS